MAAGLILSIIGSVVGRRTNRMDTSKFTNLSHIMLSNYVKINILVFVGVKLDSKK